MERRIIRKIFKFITALAIIVFVYCGIMVIQSLSVETLSMENPYFVLSLLATGWIAFILWLTN